MKSSEEKTGILSASPNPHPHFFIGGLELVFWLFFRPSAWRRHLARIDSELRPEFCLAELTPRQWRNPALRRLILKGSVVWPILVIALNALVLILWVDSSENLIWGIGYGLLLGSAGSLLVGWVVGVAGGLAGGVVISIAFSIAFAAALQTGGGINRLVEGFERMGVAGVTGGVAGIVNLGGMVGSVISVAVGVSGSLAGSPTRPGLAPSLFRQIGGIVIGVLISSIVYGMAVGMALNLSEAVSNVLTVSLVFGAMIGMAISVAFGMRARNWRRGVQCGISAGALFMGIVFLAFDPAINRTAGLLFSGMSTAIFYSTFFALSYALAERIAGPWAGSAASAIGSGGAFTAFLMIQHGPMVLPWYVFPLSLISIFLGLAFSWWQPVLFYPFQAAWNLLLYRLEQRRTGKGQSFLRWHSAFWDEFQRLPLQGLEDHLLLVLQRNPEEGRIAIEILSGGHQRWAAQAAQIELDAQGMERCEDVDAISAAHRSLPVGELQNPTQAILGSFRRISQDTNAALNQHGSFNQRLALSAVERRLEHLSTDLTRSNAPYAARFRPIASRWLNIVSRHALYLAEIVELRQEIDNPYVIGRPLTEEQGIFVGRTTVSARIARWVLNPNTPPLLLYGQRRMGKTSLLNNLGRLMPSTIIPLFVDLQGPVSLAKDYAGFLYNIARGAVASARRQRGLTLPPLSHEALVRDPFTRFDEWLDKVEEAMGEGRALLAMDEFEALEEAFLEKRFNPDEVLGTLRHLIQHRPRFTVLIAGSHTLDEVQQWAAYLINVQVAHLSYLSEGEARRLIEHPVKDFSLLYEPEAVERILHLTHCHPYLVQLLCYQIVAYKNEQDPKVRRWATVSDVEAAVPEALSQGSIFFFDLRNQVDAEGQRMLRLLALEGAGVAVRTDHLFMKFGNFFQETLEQLLHREIIEPVEDGYRFQVELVRRWFISRFPSPHPTFENPRLQ